jgi:hypothetical protein
LRSCYRQRHPVDTHCERSALDAPSPDSLFFNGASASQMEQRASLLHRRWQQRRILIAEDHTAIIDVCSTASVMLLAVRDNQTLGRKDAVLG